MPSSFNLAFVPSDNVSGMDAEILISLKPRASAVDRLHPRPSAPSCRDEFPGSLFYFQTADIVSQVLNFGLSAPIDVQIQDVEFRRAPTALGQQAAAAHAAASRAWPIAHLVQVLDFPTLQIDVDRLRAAKLGVAQRDVANNMLTSLSSSVAGRRRTSSSTRRTT